MRSIPCPLIIMAGTQLSFVAGLAVGSCRQSAAPRALCPCTLVCFITRPSARLCSGPLPAAEWPHGPLCLPNGHTKERPRRSDVAKLTLQIMTRHRRGSSAAHQRILLTLLARHAIWIDNVMLSHLTLAPEKRPAGAAHRRWTAKHVPDACLVLTTAARRRGAVYTPSH
jgi:hypothetical protein